MQVTDTDYWIDTGYCDCGQTESGGIGGRSHVPVRSDVDLQGGWRYRTSNLSVLCQWKTGMKSSMGGWYKTPRRILRSPPYKMISKERDRTHRKFAHGTLLGDDALDLFHQSKAGIVVETRVEYRHYALIPHQRVMDLDCLTMFPRSPSLQS